MTTPQNSNRHRQNRHKSLEPRVSALETGFTTLSGHVETLGKNIQHLANVINERDKQLQNSVDITNKSVMQLNKKFEQERTRLEDKDTLLDEKFYEKTRVNWGSIGGIGAFIVSILILWINWRVAPIEAVTNDNKIVLDNYIKEHHQQEIENAYKMGTLEQKLLHQQKQVETLELTNKLNGLATEKF